VGMRPRTDRHTARQTHTHTHTHTQTRVTTIHFASSTTHAKCNKHVKEVTLYLEFTSAQIAEFHMAVLIDPYVTKLGYACTSTSRGYFFAAFWHSGCEFIPLTTEPQLLLNFNVISYCRKPSLEVAPTTLATFSSSDRVLSPTTLTFELDVWR